MTPEQLNQLQQAVNALDEAYWNHQDTDYAEALATIVEVSTAAQEKLIEEKSRWGR